MQNHRSQWLQLPRASSRQDSGPKISLRRAGALTEPASPSPPPLAGVMGPRRSGRGPVARACSAPRRACGPARRAQPACCASSRQRGAGRAPPAAIAARPAGRGQSAGPAVGRWPADAGPSPTAPGPTSSTSVASVTSPASPSSSANSVTIAAKSWPLPSRCATHTTTPRVAGQGPAGAWPPAAVPSGAPRQDRGPDRAASTARTRPPRRAAGPAAGASRSGGPPRSRLDGEVAYLVSAMPRPSPARVSSRSCARPRRAAAQAPPPPPWVWIPGGSAQSRAPADRSTTQASRWSRPRGRLRRHTE
jgi:hypothetical protein